jgi:hypothetical protein
MKTEINGTKDLDGDVVAANLMDAAHNRNACKGAEPKRAAAQPNLLL